MQGAILERVTQEKDLGVVIDTGGKHAAQCQVARGKVKRVLVVFGGESFIKQKRWC